MEVILGGVFEAELKNRVIRASPNFETAKSFVAFGDKIICDAPSIIGQILAVKDEIRSENKVLEADQPEYRLNLLRMQFLDFCYKVRIRECAENASMAEHLSLCMKGKIFIRRHHLHKATV